MGHSTGQDSSWRWACAGCFEPESLLRHNTTNGRHISATFTAGTKKTPPYLSELSDDPEAIERQRQRLGLSQAASSSSGPRPDRSKFRGRLTKGTKGETYNPENPPPRRGRPPGSKKNPE